VAADSLPGDLGTGTTLAQRYRLESLLGRGAMGVVYRGRDLVLERSVAIKLLAEGTLEPAARARLLHEAQAAARLNHAHIIAVYDAGEAQGIPFIVMELVEGRNLRELATADGEGLLSVPRVTQIALQLCDALEHAHSQGIVHRDLKPENVLLLEEDGRLMAKLADLGVARLGLTSHLTMDGGVVGTPLYMAPEQAVGDPLDGRADLYSLGAMLYELVAGRPPFTGDDPLIIVSKHLHAPVVSPRSHCPDLPRDLEAAILRLLAKRPEDRFASAADTARALAATLGTAEPIIPGATAAGAPLEAAAGPPPEAAIEDAAHTTPHLALLDQLARGRLIGRTGELATLRELWPRAMRGQSQLALVSGEPGIGKTRLAGEIMVYAQLTGALVMRGGCYEFEATTPYLPFVEALRAWVHGRGAEALREDLGPLASELARLAPEIESKLGPLEANPPLSANEARLRLFDHIARFLRLRAAEEGVLLFIDDLHWADHGTLTLLHYLLRHLKSDRVLFLGAYREMELDRTHPLASALVEWNRERLATRIPLGRLSTEDTAVLLATLFEQESVSSDFVDAMYHETEGNPFFLEEVVKALIDQGQIYRGDGEWQRLEVTELTIPQSVKEAIGRRLNRLSASCTEVLHTAAALGKTFAFPELAAIVAASDAGEGGGEEKLLDALDEADGAQLIRAGRGESFTFTHDKIREVLYEELNPIRRRRLHLRIGETFESLYASVREVHVEDLAFHFTQAGDLERGLTYSQQAAEAAERLYAHDEALELYEHARESAEALDAPGRLAAVHEGIGAVHQRCGQHQLAAESFERAPSLANDPHHRAALKVRIGEAHVSRGARGGLAYLEEAVRELDPATQANEVAMATALMGRYHHYRMEHRKAAELLERARRLAEPLDDAATLVIIYGYLAGAYQHQARFEESMDWARRCIELGERKNDPAASAVGYEFLAEDSVNMGHWRETLEHTSRNRQYGESIGAQDRVAWSDFAAMLAYLVGGDLARARASGKACLSLAEEIGETRLALLALTDLALIETDLGDDEATLVHLAKVTAGADELGHKWNQFEACRARAYRHIQREEWSDALAAQEAGVRFLGETDNWIAPLWSVAHRAHVLIELGRLDEATRLTAEALRRGREAKSVYFEGIALRVEGQLLARRERWEEAAGSLDAAVWRLDEIEARLELGRALYERAKLNLRRDAAAEARADLERATLIFDEIGARRDLERAAALADNPGDPPK
jgi:tetratricopeptide (TPR) repeat protein